MNEKPPMPIEIFNGLTAAIEKEVTDLLTEKLGILAEPKFAENYVYWDISSTPIVAWDKKAYLDDLLSHIQSIVGDEFEVAVASRKYDDDAMPIASEEPVNDAIDTTEDDGSDEVPLFITKRV
jgi:hypothetical protein